MTIFNHNFHWDFRVLRNIFRRKKNYGSLSFDIETCYGHGPQINILPPIDREHSFDAFQFIKRDHPLDRPAAVAARKKFADQLRAVVDAHDAKHSRIKMKLGNMPPYTEDQLRFSPGASFHLYEANFDEIEQRVMAEYCRRDSEDALALAIFVASQQSADESRLRFNLAKWCFLGALWCLIVWGCLELYV